MPGPDEGLMLSEDAARRVAEVVRSAESARTGEVRRGRGPTIVRAAHNAVVTAAILARSGTVKGRGTATLYVDDGTGTGNMDVLSADATIWNVYSSVVSVGAWIVVDLVDGLLQVNGADC